METQECRLRPSSKKMRFDRLLLSKRSLKSAPSISSNRMKTQISHLSIILSGCSRDEKILSYWRFPIQICECNREGQSLSLALRMDLSFPGIENLRVAIVIVARGDLCRNGGVWHCQTHPYIWPSQPHSSRRPTVRVAAAYPMLFWARLRAT